MTLDLSKLYNNLQKAKDSESSEGSGRKYPYRIIFIKPDNISKLNIRILYNVKTSLATYLYRNHKLQDGSILNCGKSNQDNPTCELCNAIDNKYNLTKVTSKEGARLRTIMLAHYISSTGYQWTQEYPEPKPGDVVIVLGPSSLDKSIREMLVTIGYDAIPKILTSAEGAVISIGRDSSGKQIITTPTYSTFKSANSDDEFAKVLEDLPSIIDIALFGGVTEDDYRRLHEAAVAIDRSLQSLANNTTPSLTTPSPDQLIVHTEPMQPVQTPVVNPFPNVGEPTITQPVSAIVEAPAPTGGVVHAGTTTTTTTTTSPEVNAAAGLEGFVSQYCTKKYQQGTPICSMCLAEKFCPYKEG
jgi:hypothetical protein